MKININGKIIEVENDIITKAISIKDAPFVIRTVEEDTTFKNNYKDENIKIGAEIGRKELFKKLGIEKEGVHKSDELAATTLNEWANEFASKKLDEAKIEPNKKVEELTKDLNTLRGTLSEKDEALNTLKNEYTGYKKTNSIDKELDSYIPDNIILPKNDMKTLILNRLKLDVNENGKMFGLGEDGQAIKNQTTLEPLGGKDIITDFFNQNPQYLKTASGGAGGSDSIGNYEPNSIQAFDKEMEAAGIPVSSEKYNTELNKRIMNKTIKI